MFEHTELFQRGVGDTTDIVQKEMYTFQDYGKRSITLKPEGTSPVVRAYTEHKLYAGTDFTQRRWSLSTGIQYVKGLHTSVTPGKEKQESFVLWNLRANYRLCSFADVFVKGENLLAQRYEINAGFPMPKATVMGGVNINF